MAVPVLRQPQQMMTLLTAQQAVNVGPPDGGLAQELGVDAMAAYLRADGRIPVAATSQVLSAALRAVGAQSALLKVIESLCRHLRAFKMCHLSQEERAVLWVESIFTDAAKTVFQTAAAEDRLQDSTTVIGGGSVLYHTLLNMVALYDNPQAKREGINLLESIR